MELNCQEDELTAHIFCRHKFVDKELMTGSLSGEGFIQKALEFKLFT